MENAKRCKPKDRLSELPDSIIYEILWFLPMTDVVRTPVLSKRWRNLWTKTPFLNFDNYALMRFEDANDLRKFVHRALLCWNGERVSKFKFDWLQKFDYDFAMYSDIDLWVSFAVRNGVEELDFHVQSECTSPWDGKRGMYRVPQCVYSSSSLKKLTVDDCHLEILGNVQWNQLESLTIETYTVNEHAINQILSGSPQLRVFNLRVAGKGEKLCIGSNSLKELLIHKVSSYSDYVKPSMKLRIQTPNLETLEIVGVPFRECALMDVSSVTNATLGLLSKRHRGEDALCSGNMLSRILPIIQHVEKVTLPDCCIKVLGVIKMKCLHSSFPNVKSLELGWCLNDYEQEVGLLQIFPRLERLVLKDKKIHYHRYVREPCEFEENLPVSFLLQLWTIEVTWRYSDSMFPLIENLLQYASKLEQMVFRVKRKTWLPTPTQNSLFLVSQKLLRMPRSSPSCKIDIYDCT